MVDKKFRSVTRSDFDGDVCATLLQELGSIESVLFAEPQEMKARYIEISDNDINTNLPYVKGVYLCFDHHVSEVVRLEESENCLIDPDVPPAAPIVYRHYGGKNGFLNISLELLKAVDKANSAKYINN